MPWSELDVFIKFPANTNYTASGININDPNEIIAALEVILLVV